MEEELEKTFTLINNDFRLKVDPNYLQGRLKRFRPNHPESILQLNEDHYYIKSQAKPKEVEEFIEIGYGHQEFKITEESAIIYRELSEEFDFEIFRKKIDKYLEDRPDLIKILECIEDQTKDVQRNKAVELSSFIKIISRNLDFVLMKHPEILRRYDNSTVYEILKNEERSKRIEENQIYEFIKERMRKEEKERGEEKGKEENQMIDNKKENEKRNLESIILFDCINCFKIKEEYLIEMIEISERNEYFIPKLSERINESRSKLEMKMNEMRAEMMQEMRAEMKQEIEKIRSEQNKQKDEQEKDSRKLQEQIIDLNNTMNKMKIEIKTQMIQEIEIIQEELSMRNYNQEKNIKKIQKQQININNMIEQMTTKMKIEIMKEIEKIRTEQNKQKDKQKEEVKQLQEKSIELNNMMNTMKIEMKTEMIQEIEKIQEELSKQNDKQENSRQHIYESERNMKKLEDEKKIIEKQIQSITFSENKNKEKFENLKYEMINTIRRITKIKKSTNEDGILAYLMKNQETKFDHSFIISSSAGDIWDILNPKISKGSESDGNENFWFQIEFENEIMFKGIKIRSGPNNFPKSFQILIDEQLSKSIEEASELNGKHQEMIIIFDEIKKGKIVKILQTGQSWNNKYKFCISGIEMLSTEPEYEGGVFQSLLKKCGGDPHRLPIYFSSKAFDFNSIHLVSSNYIIKTFPGQNSWIQIEMTKGSLLIEGFRLKDQIIKSFVLKGTNDPKLKPEEWETLCDVRDKKAKEIITIDIYKTKKSGPFKYFKIIQTGRNWKNGFCLKLYHIDFFGCFISDE